MQNPLESSNFHTWKAGIPNSDSLWNEIMKDRKGKLIQFSERNTQPRATLTQKANCMQPGVQWLSMPGPAVCGALFCVFSSSGTCLSSLNEIHAYDFCIKTRLGGRGREEWWNPQLLTESCHKMLESNSYVLVLVSWISPWCEGFIFALTYFLKKLRRANSSTVSYSEVNGKFPTEFGLNLTVLEAVKMHDVQ